MNLTALISCIINNLVNFCCNENICFVTTFVFQCNTPWIDIVVFAQI